MATTPSLTGSPIRVQPEAFVTPPANVQPLWRFALVGLGPLTALGIFALLVAFFQHLS